MNLKIWQVGIDIQNNNLLAVALQANKTGWDLKKYWKVPFDISIFEHQRLIEPKLLISALYTLKQQLPKRVSIRTALPESSVLQKELPLPKQKLSETELAWFVEASLSKLFPIPANELAIDYRLLDEHKQLMVTAARRSEIEFWITLFAQAKIKLDVIDITGGVLRFMTKVASIKESELMFVDNWSVFKITTHNNQPMESMFTLACGLAMRWDDY